MTAVSLSDHIAAQAEPPAAAPTIDAGVRRAFVWSVTVTLLAWATLGWLAYDEVVFRLPGAEHRLWAYGTVAGLVSLIAMVTAMVAVRRAREHAKVVAALRASQQEVEAAQAARTRFVTSISHELRTPLNGLLGFTELIRDTTQDAQSREFAQVAMLSARQLQSVVDTILDFARVESGRMPFRPAPVEPRRLLGEALAHHEAQAAAQGLSLALSVGDDCPLVIETDGARLRTVIDQLLSNAVKFTEQGSVALAAQRADGGLRITVRDTGVGIPADRLARLFRPFENADTEFRHPAQGMGLGLPLARQLAELLGATLDIESREGEGTTATLLVPMRPQGGSKP